MLDILCCCKRSTAYGCRANKVAFLQPVLRENNSKISSEIENTTKQISLKYNGANLKYLYSIPLNSNCSDDDDDYDDLDDGAPPSDMEVRTLCRLWWGKFT